MESKKINEMQYNYRDTIMNQQNSTTIPPATVATAPPKRRWMIAAIIVLIILWCLAMLNRWEIRAKWWLYRLEHVESPQQQKYYLTCLASIGDKSFYAATGLSEYSDPEIRKIGIKCLKQIGGEGACKHLYSRFWDVSEDVAAAAALAFAEEMGMETTLQILRDHLKHTHPNSSRNAAYALERIGSPEAENVLIKALPEIENPDLKAQIIDSLGMLHSKKAVPIIEKMMSDNRPITILPVSQRRLLNAIGVLQNDLAAKGVNPQSLYDASQTQSTVFGIAQRALVIINGRQTDITTRLNTGSQPSDE